MIVVYSQGVLTIEMHHYYKLEKILRNQKFKILESFEELL